MITKKDVEHVADLARLRLTDKETELFAGQLDKVLEHVGQLDEADTEGVEPTSFVSPEHDPVRGDDEVAESLPREALLVNAPCVKKGFFAVPKVVKQ